MKNIINNIRCFLLDMDGTIYLGNQLLPGSQEFLAYLTNQNISYLFLTNNSSKSAELYAKKLSAMGLHIPTEKIFTSGEATSIYLKRYYQGAAVYMVGTQSLEKEIMQAGIQLVEEDAQLVVLGFDTSITYEKIWKFCDYVRAELPYIATHPDFNCPTEDGYMPDTGSFIALVEASTGRLPDVVIGKPNHYIIEAVEDKTGIPRNEIAMVGDRLYTDIALGKAGITTILTLSGETKKEDLDNSPFVPDHVISDLNELLRVLIDKSG